MPARINRTVLDTGDGRAHVVNRRYSRAQSDGKGSSHAASDKQSVARSDSRKSDGQSSYANPRRQSQIIDMSTYQIKLAKWEEMVFGVLYTMTERGKSTQSMFNNTLIPSFFAMVDYLQLLALLMDEHSGLDQSAVNWLFSAIDISALFLSGVKGVYVAFFWAVVAMIFATLFLTAAVAYMFLTNRFRAKPIQLLQLLVKFLLTAIYIPTIRVLVNQFQTCLETVGGGEFIDADEARGAACLVWPWHIYAGVAGLCFAIFIPFAFVVGLLYHPSSPTGFEIDRRPNGRYDLLYLAVRTMEVLIRYLPIKSDIAINLLELGFLSSLAWYAIIVQPYFAPVFNRMRGGMFFSASFVAIGSIMLQLTGIQGTRLHLILSLGWLILAFPMFALGWYITKWRYQRLMRFGAILEEDSVLSPDEEEAEAEDKARREKAEREVAAARAAEAGGGGGDAGAGVAEGLVVEEQGSRPSGGSTRRVAMDPIALLGKRPFFLKSDVEVATRFLKQNAEAEQVGKAEAIYNLGRRQYPKSAYLQLGYAIFVASYKRDTLGAIVEMKRAWAKGPSFDVRFRLTAIRRTWEQENQAANMGQEGNFVSVIEFKRLYEQAKLHHGKALKLLQSFWKAMSKRDLSLSGALDDVPSRLGAIDDAKRLSGITYDTLLHKFSNSKVLLRSYGAFLADVANDPDGAAVQYARADEIEELELRRRGDDGTDHGGTDRGSEKGPSEKSPEDGEQQEQQQAALEGAGKNNKKLKHISLRQLRFTADEEVVVKRMWRGTILALILLAALAAASYAVTATLFSEFEKSVYRAQAASDQRRVAVMAALDMRTLQQEAMLGNKAEVASMAKELEKHTDDFERQHAGLFFGFSSPTVPPSSDSAIRRLWKEESTGVRTFIAGTSPYTSIAQMTLFDIGTVFVARMRRVTKTPLETLARPDAVAVDPDFRFVYDNSPFTILDLLKRLCGLYQEEIVSATTLRKLVTAALLAVTLASLLAVVFAVFRPALNKIRHTNHGVSDVLNAIPRGTIKQIAKWYAARKSLDEQGGSSEDGRSDRDEWGEEDEESPGPEGDEGEEEYYDDEEEEGGTEYETDLPERDFDLSESEEGSVASGRRARRRRDGDEDDEDEEEQGEEEEEEEQGGEEEEDGRASRRAPRRRPNPAMAEAAKARAALASGRGPVIPSVSTIDADGDGAGVGAGAESSSPKRLPSPGPMPAPGPAPAPEKKRLTTRLLRQATFQMEKERATLKAAQRMRAQELAAASAAEARRLSGQDGELLAPPEPRGDRRPSDSSGNAASGNAVSGAVSGAVSAARESGEGGDAADEQDAADAAVAAAAAALLHGGPAAAAAAAVQAVAQMEEAEDDDEGDYDADAITRWIQQAREAQERGVAEDAEGLLLQPSHFRDENERARYLAENERRRAAAAAFAAGGTQRRIPSGALGAPSFRRKKIPSGTLSGKKIPSGALGGSHIPSGSLAPPTGGRNSRRRGSIGRESAGADLPDGGDLLLAPPQTGRRRKSLGDPEKDAAAAAAAAASTAAGGSSGLAETLASPSCLGGSSAHAVAVNALGGGLNSARKSLGVRVGAGPARALRRPCAEFEPLARRPRSPRRAAPSSAPAPSSHRLGTAPRTGGEDSSDPAVREALAAAAAQQHPHHHLHGGKPRRSVEERAADIAAKAAAAHYVRTLVGELRVRKPAVGKSILKGGGANAAAAAAAAAAGGGGAAAAGGAGRRTGGGGCGKGGGRGGGGREGQRGVEAEEDARGAEHARRLFLRMTASAPSRCPSPARPPLLLLTPCGSYGIALAVIAAWRAEINFGGKRQHLALEAASGPRADRRRRGIAPRAAAFARLRALDELAQVQRAIKYGNDTLLLRARTADEGLARSNALFRDEIVESSPWR
eukprot:tig00000270_g23920.t1